MAEDFEVRGAHEEAVERHAERREPLAQRIALFSAVLATLGAVVILLGGHAENVTLYYKNEAVLMKARAPDIWTYYHAGEIKRHLFDPSGGGRPDAARVGRVAAYAANSAKLRALAEALDRSEIADEELRHATRRHLKLAVAMTLLLIATALASIAALTRRRWLFIAAGLAAALGCPARFSSGLDANAL